jgi:hypothetical protein
MRRIPVAFCVPLALLVSACSPPSATPVSGSNDDLTSVSGNARRIEWDSFVYVPLGADDATIATAIRRQVKSSLGALRERTIGIADRDARSNLDPKSWVREPLDVVAADGSPVRSIERVRYHYVDTALVGKSADPGASLTFTLLFGDYTQAVAAAALQPACVDEPTDADSLWYHYAPRRAACASLIAAEAKAIAAEQARVGDQPGRVVRSDAERRFVPVRATLTPIAAAPVVYPEYDRLWGFGSDRQKVVIYTFVGVDHDLRDSHDISAIEYQRLLRTVRARFPQLRVVETQPFAYLLDFWIDGNKLEGVTFDDVHRWMIDDAGYPPAVGSDPRTREALRQQVIDRFAERTIVWQLPVTVSRGAEAREMTIELRTFWGLEDGSAEIKQRAIWRYLEAFWHADVFSYTGHSHFGHGPLEPTHYWRGNFPERYQVMLVNSCLSYNYYDLDFVEMHPNGSRDLDIVMNGLPAYWSGMGEATGRYLTGLLDGENRSWAQILDGMRVADPWGRPGYEPMRAVNGELDNAFNPAAGGPIVVRAR